MYFYRNQKGSCISRIFARTRLAYEKSWIINIFSILLAALDCETGLYRFKMADRSFTTLEHVLAHRNAKRETPLFDATLARSRAPTSRRASSHLACATSQGETRVFHALFRAFLPLSLSPRRTTLHAPWARISANVPYASIKNYWSTRCQCACVLRIRARARARAAGHCVCSQVSDSQSVLIDLC